MSTEWIMIFLMFFHFSWSGVLAENITMEACEPKKCGNLSIGYPFWISGEQPEYCGYPSLEIDCSGGKSFLPRSYNMYSYIHKIFYENNSAVLINSKLVSEACPIQELNITLTFSQFHISPSPLNKELVFFYNCSETLNPPSDYSPITACTNRSYLSNETFVRLYSNYPDETQDLPDDLPSDCSIAEVPVLGRTNLTAENYLRLMEEGFLVQMVVANCSLCKESNGQCGYSSSSNNFVCICSNGTMYPTSCPISGPKSHLKQILTGSVVAGVLVLVFISLIFIVKSKIVPHFLWKYNTQENIELILEKHGSLAPKRYKYSELKKITNSFHDKLGEGGFGTVYKGTEEIGDLVAVKFLHSSTSNGEEFINEVISISRTSHVNIVNLLGVCIHGSKQALVYEYMPNGSLDQYIYAENPKLELGWEKLYDIAIGIARGLEYLHSGCSTQIVHFDIKPQNILLDEDFRPKIADFGLAKLCPPKVSIISMEDMRGTVGFIAPEVFSRSVGVVSTKSDVYSFGMLVLEMVGGRKNVKPSVKNSSQVYFPDWIYEHVAEAGQIQVCDVSKETEEVARKMSMVGFWCTQTIPGNRPSMSRVLEMLERSLDELEMPPKPYFNSPPRNSILFPSESSSTISSKKESSSTTRI